MKNSLIALALAAIASTAQAQVIREDWTDADTVRQLAVTATLAADYAQTRDIKNHPRMYEENSLLGRHPSDARVRNYFVGAALAHYGVARVLPAGWPRQSFQYAWIAIEVAQVVRNRRAGLKFKF